MEDLVSVIVPVYNNVMWIKQCVDSLLFQTYQNMEIILVDDQSMDGSAEICDYYAKKSSKVKVIHQENRGVSTARNKGIEEAKGEWLAFVDSDDYLSRNIIELAVQTAEKNFADMVCWNFAELRSGNIFPCEPIYIDSMRKEDVVSAIIAGYRNKFCLGKYVRSACGKLFKREIIVQNNIRFAEDLYIGEDAVFLLSCVNAIDHISLCNEYGYYYRILDSSAVRRYKEDLLEQNIRQYEYINGLIDRTNRDKAQEEAIQMFQWVCFRNIVINSCLNGSKRKRYWDAQQWYRRMRSDKPVCSCHINWGRKLYQLQSRIGVKVPMICHYYFVLFWEKAGKRSKFT